MKRFEDVQNFLNAEWVETMRKPLSSKKDDEQTTLGDIS
jgi:hypothetical protein